MYKKILQKIFSPFVYDGLYGIKMELIKICCGGLGKNSSQLFRDELKKQIENIEEIGQLFPPEKIKEHYVYGNVRDTIDHPDILITQMRYYRVYQYLKKNYPEIFDNETAVLDVGDTSGILFKAMARKGTSLNINKECVDFIKSKGIEAVKGDAENIQFGDKSFDYVFCFQCLEHVPNPLKVLNELGRIAKKKVFLSVPYTQQTRIYDIQYWKELKKNSWKEPNVKDVDCHIFEFSTEDFKKILSHTSLEYETSFPIVYFNPDSFRRKMLNKHFTSYFNFFVLRPKTNAGEKE